LGYFSNVEITEVIIMDATAVTAITSAVDFTSIVTGIGTIAAAIVVVLIAVKGAKALLSMVRGG